MASIDDMRGVINRYLPDVRDVDLGVLYRKSRDTIHRFDPEG
jgi:hypothetical protein